MRSAQHFLEIVEEIIKNFYFITEEETELLVRDLIPKINMFHKVENEFYDNEGKSKAMKDHDERERQYSRLNEWDFANALSKHETYTQKRFREQFSNCVKQIGYHCR